VLRYWNDLSYAEIAEVTGLTEATVKTRLFRARKMLADMLDPAEVATETSSS
jgi:RNA polymerase sigma-70 factor, ECF subfamily